VLGLIGATTTDTGMMMEWEYNVVVNGEYSPRQFEFRPNTEGKQNFNVPSIWSY